MPERRTSSVTSFMSNLHFSGKVIMGSVLFGFGLLLVGAIFLIIATGGQKSPPLQENREEKKTPMIYVGPGVMGVGAFFVIVGTIMCLFETRIFRRRKNTGHESLVHSEVLPTENTNLPTTDNQEDHEKEEENAIKTTQAECHTENPSKSLEKSSLEVSAEKGDYERQFSSSTDRDQAQSLTASVYVEAFGGDDIDENDNEEHFTSESMQFSTPPQGEEADEPKISLGSQSIEGHDPVNIPYSSQSAQATTEAEKGSPLISQKGIENPQAGLERNESSLLVPKDNEIPMPVLKDNEIPVPVSNDSVPISVTTHNDGSGDDVTKLTDRPVYVPEGTEVMKSNNKVKEELQNEMSRVLAPTELPDSEGKDELAPDSNETTIPSVENTELTNT